MADWTPITDDDPIPGDPVALAALVTGLRDDVRGIWSVVGQLQGINATGIWSGEAAEAFTRRRQSVVPDLDRAARRLDRAASALDTFSRAMGESQFRARTARDRARTARQAITHAQTQRDDLARHDASARRTADTWAAQHPDLTPPPPPASIAPDWTAAMTRGQEEMAAARLLFNQACDVYAQAEHRCDQILGDTTDAALADPKQRGFLGRVGQAVANIADHFTDLEKFSELLGATAAVVGVASMVPGLQFLAPAALVTSGLKMAIDVNLAVTGRQGWSHVVWDGLGLATLGVGRIATVGARGSVASQATTNLERVKEVRALGNVQGFKWTTTEGVDLSGKAASRYVKNTSAKYLREFRADALEGWLPSWRRSVEAMRRPDIALPAQKVLDISPQAVRWATGANLLVDTGTLLDVWEVARIVDPNDERPHFVASSHPRAREAEGRQP